MDILTSQHQIKQLTFSMDYKRPVTFTALIQMLLNCDQCTEICDIFFYLSPAYYNFEKNRQKQIQKVFPHCKTSYRIQVTIAFSPMYTIFLTYVYVVFEPISEPIGCWSDRDLASGGNGQYFRGSEPAALWAKTSISVLRQLFIVHATEASSNVNSDYEQNSSNTKILSRRLNILHVYAHICL